MALSPDKLIRKVEGTPPAIGTSELGMLASTYARVFAGEPWFEVTRCPVEDRFFGSDTYTGSVCPSDDCEAELEDAYPLDGTMEYIKAEVDKPHGSLFLVDGFDDDIAGFGWSYAFRSPEEFAEKKYHTDTMRERVVDELGRRGVSGMFFYISEIGLLPDDRYRGRRFSNSIGLKFIEEANSLGMDTLLRTSSRSPMYFTSLSMGMNQITGPLSFKEPGGFVYTDDLVSDFVDDEGAGRTLFLYKQPR